ncbi:MAG: EAL domain-containing protein [Pseudomonadota bacterium]
MSDTAGVKDAREGGAVQTGAAGSGAAGSGDVGVAEVTAAAAAVAAFYDDLSGRVAVLRRRLAPPRGAAAAAPAQTEGEAAALREDAEAAVARLRVARRDLAAPAQAGDQIAQRFEHVEIALDRAADTAVAAILAAQLTGLAEDLRAEADGVAGTLATMQEALAALDRLAGEGAALADLIDPAAIGAATEDAAALAASLPAPVAAAAGDLDALAARLMPGDVAPPADGALDWLEDLYTMDRERTIHRDALTAAAEEPAEATDGDVAAAAAPPTHRREALIAFARGIIGDDRHLFLLSFPAVFALAAVLTAALATDGMLSGLATLSLVALTLVLAAQAGLTLHARAADTFEKARRDFERMAFHDPLTDVLNRRGLTRLLDGVLGTGKGDAPPASQDAVVALHIDLDHFKAVNDTLGHEAGDHVLEVATERMKTAVGTLGSVARVGGDEFCVVLTGDGVARAEAVAGEIVERTREPIDYGAQQCRIGASIGIARAGGDAPALSTERLLSDADLATYVAKSEGRGRYAFFDMALREKVEREGKIAAGLREALDQGALGLWLQPVVTPTADTVLGAEALLRWRDPRLGEIEPETLLAVAEQHNLLDQVQDRVHLMLAEVLGALIRADALPGRIGLNMDGAELRRHGVVDRLRFALDRAECPPERIAVEVTERACGGRGAELALETVRGLRRLGLGVTVDRFGRDDVSLAGLTEIRATGVKLDRALVRQLGPGGEGQTLLRGLVSLSRSLSLEICACGVETREQLALLGEVGCDSLQGHAIARAMPVDSYVEWATFFTPKEDRAAS